MKKTLLIVMSMILSAPSWAYDFMATITSGQYLAFTILDSANHTVEIVRSPSSYGNHSGNLVIPTNVTYENITYSVVSIGDKAFSGCSGLTSVTIPSTIESIVSSAFYECTGLLYVNFPDTLALANWCHFSFGPSTWAYLSPTCYAHNIAINGVIITNLVIPHSVDSIGKGVFYGCSGISSITIPNTITTIGNSAFYGCSGLVSANFEDMSALTNWCNVSLGDEYSNPIYYAHEITVGGIPVRNLIIDNSVSSIGDYAFVNADQLTSVVIPNTVTSIGNRTFQNCDKIKSISIPNSVTTIGQCAFGQCDSLKYFTLGNSVTSIWNNTFQLCYALDSVCCFSGFPPSRLGNSESTFGGCGYTVRKLVVPCGRESFYSSWSSFFYQTDCENIFTLNVQTNNANWGTVTGSGSYLEGSDVAITAEPLDSHRHFINWNDGSTEMSRTITIVTDTTFTANFSCDQYSVTVSSAQPTMGFVTGDGTYDYGSTAIVTATPYPEFTFLYWNDGSTNPSRELIVTQDMELVAYFGLNNGIGSPDISTLDSQLSIFPNPASDKLTVRLGGLTGPAQLIISDILGREVVHMQIDEGEISFPVSTWVPGTYFVKMVAADGTSEVKKLIII